MKDEDMQEILKIIQEKKPKLFVAISNCLKEITELLSDDEFVNVLVEYKAKEKWAYKAEGKGETE